MIEHDTWVLVADAKKAMLLRNRGTSIRPDLVTERVIEAPDNPATRHQGADRPGRAQVGERRSAMEQTDWHQLGEEAFAKTLAAALDDLVAGKGVGGLVLVAPPRMLGSLRPALSGRARAIVKAEFDKDLVQRPLAEIAALFAAP